jgi:PAS domain S-box-containing protein
MSARNRTNKTSSEESVRQALRAREYQFHQLVDGVRDYAIFLLDADGNVASWSQGAEQIKGYQADEIIGKHFSVFYTPESIEKGWPEYELRTASKEGRFEDEGWRVRRDGSRFWANVTITALRDENGATEAFLKITRDLTARKLVEEQNARLNRAQIALAEAEIAERQALFLAEASQALSGSLDEERIYQSVTQAAVPFLADICIVDRLGEDGSARLAAVNLSGMAPAGLPSLLGNYYPIGLDDGYLVSEVLRTGRTTIFGDLSKLPKNNAKLYRAKTDCVFLQALSAQAAVAVPLIDRGAVCGAISFILTDPSRHYNLAEITLAEDLGKRLSTAIDHAFLYASAQEAQR